MRISFHHHYCRGPSFCLPCRLLLCSQPRSTVTCIISTSMHRLPRSGNGVAFTGALPQHAAPQANSAANAKRTSTQGRRGACMNAPMEHPLSHGSRRKICRHSILTWVLKANEATRRGSAINLYASWQKPTITKKEIHTTPRQNRRKRASADSKNPPLASVTLHSPVTFSCQ